MCRYRGTGYTQGPDQDPLPLENSVATTAVKEDVDVSSLDDPFEYIDADDAERAREALVAQVARDAEARWKLHRRRIRADRFMDERRKAAYLDKTLITIADGTALLGVSAHRISQARGGRKHARGVPLPVRQWPHPSVYPPPARVQQWIYGKPVYEWYRGEVIRWAERRGLNLLNLDTGERGKLRNRSGRPRSERTTRSKQHVPGTPRKGKKTETETDE